MSVRMNNKLGSIEIDTNVVATYAGSVAVECFGIVGMASVNMKDGLVKLLGKEHLGHGIAVRMNGGRIELDFHVIVSYGVSISAVAENLVSSVKYKLEAFTSMEVEKITVFVEGVRVID
ncbi:MAG: Asp23/Gls24 family envelope stress response protein [Lachnospiraceae bacterium]|nr:Asp23/Gls24 family envelope stress response protein [Lachnospiraceae bacterium]